MTTPLPIHLREMEKRMAVLQLAIQGLRAAYAIDPAAHADFDAVCHDAAKLRAHLQGVRIECEYAKGGTA